jgi:hypothetical protein
MQQNSCDTRCVCFSNLNLQFRKIVFFFYFDQPPTPTETKCTLITRTFSAFSGSVLAHAEHLRVEFIYCDIRDSHSGVSKDSSLLVMWRSDYRPSLTHSAVHVPLARSPNVAAQRDACYLGSPPHTLPRRALVVVLTRAVREDLELLTCSAFSRVTKYVCKAGTWMPRSASVIRHV